MNKDQIKAMLKSFADAHPEGLVSIASALQAIDAVGATCEECKRPLEGRCARCVTTGAAKQAGQGLLGWLMSPPAQ